MNPVLCSSTLVAASSAFLILLLAPQNLQEWQQENMNTSRTAFSHQQDVVPTTLRTACRRILSTCCAITARTSSDGCGCPQKLDRKWHQLQRRAAAVSNTAWRYTGCAIRGSCKQQQQQQQQQQKKANTDTSSSSHSRQQNGLMFRSCCPEHAAVSPQCSAGAANHESDS